jgi:hypothetical protein
MQPADKIPLSRFPADLTSILALPGTTIFFVIAYRLPLFWRTTFFVLVGIALIALGIGLLRSGRVLLWVWAAIYLLMGIGMFYIAFVEATLFV